MPSNGRTFGGSNSYAQFLNSWGNPSSDRPRVNPQSTAAAGAHSHVVFDEMAAIDENYALEASPAPVFVPAPEDFMVPHESDTGAIRSLREGVSNAGPDDPTVGNLRSVLQSLCHIRRTTYNETQGTNLQTRASAAPPPPPQPFGGTPGEWIPRSLRSRRGSSGSVQAEPSQTFFGNVPDSSQMTTVAQIFGMRVNYPTIEKHPFIVGTNLAGVEIELENLAIEHPSFDYWTAKSDGSLRNSGMEFVCSHPWGGIDLYNAALEIDGFLFNNNPDDTWRCSTHVHVDVRDLTVPQLKKMILAYVFFERVLFKCSGWHRYKNNFCVALGFAQGQLDDLANWWALEDSAFVNRVVSNWDKYTAINLLPMSSFGSVEFRISEAKWHKGQLIRLTNRFLSLKEIAVERCEMTDEEFIESLMAGEMTDVIKKGVPRGIGNVQQDLEVGYKLAYDIISLAKIRRRSRRLFVPDLEDGSRIMTNVQPFINGWQHCRQHLTSRYPDLEFPEQIGTTFNFSWLYELRKMMRRHRLTFENIWFMPEQNREQLRRLFRQYHEERDANAPAEVPEAPTRRNAPSAYATWMADSEPTEPDFGEEDDDSYDEDEHI